MRQRVAALWRRLRPRPRILMYHRVADVRCDPWGLAVHPERFAEQMAVLARQRTPLPMDAFVARLQGGTLPAAAVAVTFDDGYADNLHAALPVLRAAGVPATLFVASAAIGSPHGFWWDELAHMLLLRDAPLRVDVDLGGLMFELRLGASEPADQLAQWRAWQPPATARQRAYCAVWERLKAMAPAAQSQAMAALRGVCGAAAATGDRAMSEAEVCAITACGLVQLGGHTARHPGLPALPLAEQRAELLEGRGAVERWAGAPVTGFAYPYGAMCRQSRDAVADCGFRWACATDPALPMHKNSDPFALPRLAAADVGGAAFERALAA